MFVVVLPEGWAPHEEPRRAESVALEPEGPGEAAFVDLVEGPEEAAFVDFVDVVGAPEVVSIPAAVEPSAVLDPEPSTLRVEAEEREESDPLAFEPSESVLAADPVPESGLDLIREEEAEEVMAVEEEAPAEEEAAAEELTAAEAPPAPRGQLPTAAPPLSPPPKQEPRYVDLSRFANDALAEEAPEVIAWPPKSPAAGRERFGKRDPHERAQHLARVLVSDIIAYYPVRYQEALSRGTLPTDFENEIKKSWREYVDQVGAEMAEATPYFNEALNEVLARGGKVF